MWRHIVLTFALCLSTIYCIGQSAGNLTIKINGIESVTGQIVVAVCRNQAEVDEPYTPFRYKIEKVKAVGSLTTVLDLPSGEYTIMVFHDENGNTKHDTNMLGIPKEKYGFSNNRFSKIGGKPTFQEAKIKVTQQPQTTHINLRWFKDK